ncbi:MAG TPA: PAS domain S-box protein, partial [Ktedonobacterales bacterium]|nr:PAS domain S-box protein [Ktedonobacterales bacterium]
MLPQCHDDGSPSSAVSSPQQKAQEFAWASALIQTALDGIIIIDHLGRIEEFNPAAEQIFGYMRDEVIGRLLAECVIPPAFRAAHHRGLMRYLATEEGHILDRRLELSGMRANGTEFPVELTVTRLHQDGAPRFMGTLRDMTERASLEDRLRAVAQAERQARITAEARVAQLEAIFTTMTDGIFVMDAQGRVLHQNPAAAKLLQREAPIDPMPERPAQPTVLDGQGFPIPESDLPFRRILRGETLSGANTVDLQLRLADDQLVAVNLSGAPIRDGQGEIVAAVSICRDVTERRRFERQTHTALKALLDLAHVLVHGDETGEGRSLQAAAQQVLMVTRQVLGCQRVAIIQVDAETDQMSMLAVDGVSMEASSSPSTGASLRESLPANMVRQLHEGEAMFIDMTQPPWHTHPNLHGAKVVEIFPMRIGADLVGLLAFDYGGADHPLTPDEHALAVAVVQLAALVLERERLIAAREMAHAHILALQEAQHRMDQFLSLASHEIRTPLTHCKGGVQLALRRLERVLTDHQQVIAPEQLQPVQEILAATDRQTSRLARLVKDLLDVSRIQLAALEMRMSTCDVMAVVSETVSAHHLAKPDRVIQIAAPDMPLLIYADADRIGQVVQNLLTNALKFAPSDRPIQVRIIAEGAQIRVEVQDEGPGIPLDQQERIFERFYHPHSACPVAV